MIIQIQTNNQTYIRLGGESESTENVSPAEDYAIIELQGDLQPTGLSTSPGFNGLLIGDLTIDGDRATFSIGSHLLCMYILVHYGCTCYNVY